MTNRPNAALIDIGNVLLAFDFESALLRLVPTGTSDGLARINSLLDRKDEFETGRIGEEEFIAWASAKLGFTGGADLFRDTWNSIFEPIHPMWDAMATMKEAGLRLFLFSNTNAIHGTWALNNYAVMNHFDGRTFSYEVDSIKPEPAIYESALREHGLQAGNTLYVDDLPQNIATGETFGLRCHQYDLNNHAAFTDWLSEQLG